MLLVSWRLCAGCPLTHGMLRSAWTASKGGLLLAWLLVSVYDEGWRRLDNNVMHM